MSHTDKRTLKIRKLSLNRETLRTLSGEQLEEVAGGWPMCRDLGLLPAALLLARLVFDCLMRKQ